MKFCVSAICATAIAITFLICYAPIFERQLNLQLMRTFLELQHSKQPKMDNA